MRTTLFFFLIIFSGIVCFFPQNGFAQEPMPMVRLIYFIPNDRTPDPKIDTKMDMLIKEVQQFYSEMMESHGFGKKTFQFQTDRTGKAVVHHINGEFADAHYFDETVDKVLGEVRKQFDTSKSIYVIAINSDYHVTVRTAWGNFDGVGGWTLIPTEGIGFGVGVSAHELGHAFGLTHDYRDPDDLKLVSSPYTSDRMITSFCAAEWLDVHPYFNAGQQNQNLFDTTINMLSPRLVSEPLSIRLRFEVADSDSLHQVQLITSEGTYSGGLIACKSLNGTSSVVEFTTTELAPKDERVSLRVMDVHGNFTVHWFPIDIISLLPPSKVISIPDVNLAAAVREALNLDSGTVLTSHKMLELTHLNAPNRQITDLTGLEHALNLKELWVGADLLSNGEYVSSNAISDLSPIERLPKLSWMMLANPSEAAVAALPRLTRLRYLQIYNPPLSDVSVIAGLTQLEVLQVYNPSTPDVSSLVSALAELTQLRTLTLEDISSSNVDVSALSALTQLERLDIEGKSISDVSSLSKLIHLRSLSIGNTSVSDVSALSGLTQLRVLYLYNSPISNISALVGLTQLRYLEILDTSVSDISALAGLTQLEGLKLGDSPISDVSPLTRLTQLVELGLWNTFVSDISPLVELTQLTWLNLNGSPLSYRSIHTYIPAIQAGVEWVHFNNVAHPALLKVSGDAQESTSGAALAIPFVVEAMDANGKPMQGVSVTFAVTTGRGTLSATTATTDPTGKAQTTLTLGPNPGKHTVTATANEITPSVLTFTAVAVGNPVRIAEDVNGDGAVNIQDLVLAASSVGQIGQSNADVNDDGVVNIIDILLVAVALEEGTTAAPVLQPLNFEGLTASQMQRLLTQARQIALADPTHLQGVEVLAQLLILLLPKETVLLSNYPNPLNPETWIPYQLAKPTEVTLRIYSLNGALVRTLALGHQPAGMYHNKSRAAYWNGRNEHGEHVASGVYFYTLSAGDFTATRKLLILK